MFYFSYYWILRNLKLSEIVMLLFLMMTTLFIMPWNVWGDEIYTYRDKEGTIVITNIYPQENIDFNTWKSNTYQDLTPKGRLHRGRNNALIDVQKRRYGQRKTVKDGGGIDAGIYKIKI